MTNNNKTKAIEEKQIFKVIDEYIVSPSNGIFCKSARISHFANFVFFYIDAKFKPLYKLELNASTIDINFIFNKEQVKNSKGGLNLSYVKDVVFKTIEKALGEKDFVKSTIFYDEYHFIPRIEQEYLNDCYKKMHECYENKIKPVIEKEKGNMQNLVKGEER